MGEILRQAGSEFGATTGRPRRTGWFDAVALREAVRTNGLSGLAITKIDVLSGLDSIKICTAYSYQGQLLEDFPHDLQKLQDCKPVYEEFDGWKCDICGVTTYEELPEQVKSYLKKVEEVTGCPVALISVGPRRDQTVQLRNPFEE
jgi:adenylosuccinate synthase